MREGVLVRRSIPSTTRVRLPLTACSIRHWPAAAAMAASSVRQVHCRRTTVLLIGCWGILALASLTSLPAYAVDGSVATDNHGIGGRVQQLSTSTPLTTRTTHPPQTVQRMHAAMTEKNRPTAKGGESVGTPAGGVVHGARRKAPLGITPTSAATAVPVIHPPGLSLPGTPPSEVAVRLLLGQESHMAEIGPKMILGFFRFVGYVCAMVVFAVWWFQGGLLYMPSFGRPGESKQLALNTVGFRSPAEYHLPYEEAWIDGPDGTRTHGWLILQPSPSSSPTVIFFHGNAGNIGYRLPNCKSLYYTCRCNILIVDYRGYGHSAGEPSEDGIRMDALAALKYLRHDRILLGPTSTHVSLTGSAASGLVERPPIDLTRIYLFGRSLGGAVAIATAHADQLALNVQRRRSTREDDVPPPLAGILLENTFCTLIEMVLVLASRLGVIPKESTMLHYSSSSRVWRNVLSYLMVNHWRSLEVIGEIETPMLFLSGLADELIPSTHMSGLFSSARSCSLKRLHVVPDGTHNDTFVRGGMEYYRAWFEFIQETSQRVEERAKKQKDIQIGGLNDQGGQV